MNVIFPSLTFSISSPTDAVTLSTKLVFNAGSYSASSNSASSPNPKSLLSSGNIFCAASEFLITSEFIPFTFPSLSLNIDSLPYFCCYSKNFMLLIISIFTPFQTNSTF